MATTRAAAAAAAACCLPAAACCHSLVDGYAVDGGNTPLCFLLCSLMASVAACQAEGEADRILKRLTGDG